LIYGMPRVAFESGAVMRQYSLTHMAEGIIEACGASAVPHARAS
jgi:chemotaxis response regulator CheB